MQDCAPNCMQHKTCRDRNGERLAFDWDGVSELTTNLAGEWVPAIPLPFYHGFHKKCGQCGRKFWYTVSYRSHYALTHILKLEKR